MNYIKSENKISTFPEVGVIMSIIYPSLGCEYEYSIVSKASHNRNEKENNFALNPMRDTSKIAVYRDSQMHSPKTISIGS